MPASFIYKPGTSKGPVFLAPQESGRNSPPVITTADGRKIVGKYYNTNEGRSQWIFPSEIIGLSDLTIEFGGQTGQITSGGQSFEGSAISGWDPRAKGSVGAGGAGGQFTPGSDPTGHGFFPGYLGGEFPSPVLSQYDPITAAPYQFTDPMEFSKGYAPFARDQLAQNNELAKQFAYSALDTELKALNEFIPQQAELKRRETNLDNFFNQEQRLAQVDQGVPGARQDLEAQRGRANTYASGQLPDEQADRGLELGVRSKAADLATAGGFGASSSVSRKASDLMSAQQRLQVALQGENLVNQNVNARANLLLAPTEYSNAGSQINVNPSVSPAQLQTAARNEITAQAGISANQAFSSNIQQNQFTTGLEQSTRTFNASNTLQNNQFNAGTQNNFALTKFGYDVSYAGAVAGAYQTGANTQLALEQQKLAQQIFQDHQQQAQNNEQLKSVLGGISTILSGIGGGKGGGVTDAITKVIDLIGGYLGGSNSTEAGAGNSLGGGAADSANNPGPDFGGDDTSSPDSAGDSNSIGGGAADSGSTDTGGSDTSSDGGGGYTPDTGPSDADLADTGGAEPPLPADSDLQEFSLSRKAAYNTGSKAYDHRLTNFTNDTGIQIPKSVTRQAGRDAAGVLRSSGISYTPNQNSQRMGVDYQGRYVYADKNIARSADTSVGDKVVQTFKSVFDPMNTFSKEDSTALSQIGTIASDAAFLGNLTQLVASKNKKGFVNAILGKFQKPLLDNFGKDPKNAGQISAAFTAYNLFQNWDNMSPASKSLAIAHLGISSYQGVTGVNLNKQVIPGTGTNGTPSLTIGNALDLFATGYNVYGLVKNWDQYNDMQKVIGGAQTVANIANTAKNLGMLGTGTSNAAAGGSAISGGSASGSAGAGGVAGEGATSGYYGSSTVAEASPGAAGYALGGVAVAAGVYQVAQGWGEGGTKGATNGLLGGGAIVAGLYAMGYSNPYTAAAIIAISVAGNMIKTGKHEDQYARDGMRGLMKKNGIIDSKYRLTLADGTEVNLGADGHEAEHDAKDPSKIVGKDAGRKLHSYDLDYTNDLDYASGMGGIALSRLLAGGKQKNVDQLGGQLGNAAIANIGYGKDLTKENFSKMVANQRAMYAKAGINSKEGAYALANQAYKEGRVNETDLVAMQQAFNMMYDGNGYDTAQKLMAGRHRGIEVAEGSAQHGDDNPNNKPITDPTFPSANKPTFNPRDPSTFGNRPAGGTGDTGFSKPMPAGINTGAPQRPGTGINNNYRPPAASPTGPSARLPGQLNPKLTTREEMLQRNKYRYAGRSA